ncbi:hypothetical protein POPTR_007G103901v4 [Populus trichocarpa]|jgi:hypothetical protein|uniref:Uncharacterized protein n=1 Tax=Populus trichocarpa TaxID=3694 RepID=A0ACC0SQQ1_POPTR|nr:hypothetical protein POPTR_007G103901v4 [Populus trichocarpa]
MEVIYFSTKAALSIKKSAKSFIFPLHMPIFLFFFPVISVHKTSLNITIKVKTNLLHFGEGVCVHGRETEDENHGNRTDGHGGGSPENPCLKSCSSNNHNSKEQEHFLPIANVGRVMNKAIPI